MSLHICPLPKKNNKSNKNKQQKTKINKKKQT
jgi:hypothetical protein